MHTFPFWQVLQWTQEETRKAVLRFYLKEFLVQDKLLEGKYIRMLVLKKSVSVKFQYKRRDVLMLVNQLLVLRWMELQEYTLLLI